MINQEEEDKRSKEKERYEGRREKGKRRGRKRGEKDGPKIRMFNHKFLQTFCLENVAK